MSKLMDGKVAVVTGAGGGIGREIPDPIKTCLEERFYLQTQAAVFLMICWIGHVRNLASIPAMSIPQPPSEVTLSLGCHGLVLIR